MKLQYFAQEGYKTSTKRPHERAGRLFGTWSDKDWIRSAKPAGKSDVKLTGFYTIGSV